MGVLRLAAIFDIDMLQKASDKLRNLYEDWRLLGIESDRMSRDSKVRKKITDIAGELDRIGNDIKFGLSHRVERSAYYVKSWEDIVGDLRTKIVHGFQPYPAFVQCRMGGTFEFVRRVGSRHRELRNEIELILERQRTDDITSLQERAVELVNRIKSID